MSGSVLDKRSATPLKIIKDALTTGNFISRDLGPVRVDESFFRN